MRGDTDAQEHFLVLPFLSSAAVGSSAPSMRPPALLACQAACCSPQPVQYMLRVVVRQWVLHLASAMSSMYSSMFYIRPPGPGIVHRGQAASWELSCQMTLCIQTGASCLKSLSRYHHDTALEGSRSQHDNAEHMLAA